MPSALSSSSFAVPHLIPHPGDQPKTSRRRYQNHLEAWQEQQQLLREAGFDPQKLTEDDLQRGALSVLHGSQYRPTSAPAAAARPAPLVLRQHPGDAPETTSRIARQRHASQLEAYADQQQRLARAGVDPAHATIQEISLALQSTPSTSTSTNSSTVHAPLPEGPALLLHPGPRPVNAQQRLQYDCDLAAYELQHRQLRAAGLDPATTPALALQAKLREISAAEEAPRRASRRPRIISPSVVVEGGTLLWRRPDPTPEASLGTAPSSEPSRPVSSSSSAPSSSAPLTPPPPSRALGLLQPRKSLRTELRNVFRDIERNQENLNIMEARRRAIRSSKDGGGGGPATASPAVGPERKPSVTFDESAKYMMEKLQGRFQLSTAILRKIVIKYVKASHGNDYFRVEPRSLTRIPIQSMCMRSQ